MSGLDSAVGAVPAIPAISGDLCSLGRDDWKAAVTGALADPCAINDSDHNGPPGPRDGGEVTPRSRPPPLATYMRLPPDDDPLPAIEPEPLPVTLPDPVPVMLPEPVPPWPELPDVRLPAPLPADPTSKRCPCCAACRLCAFRRSISAFCEVSVSPERDERIACSAERCVLCEPAFADWSICLLPDVSELAVLDRLALVEFIPVVDEPG